MKLATFFMVGSTFSVLKSLMKQFI